MSFEQKTFASSVEGAADADGGVLEEREEQKRQMEEDIRRVQEEIAEVKRRGQQLVEANRFNFELFAESAAPRFVMSNGFYMLFEKKEVHMDAKWFFEKECSDEQILWANYHELGHFWDFVEDHRAILGKFEDIEGQSKITGKMLSEKFRAKFGGEHPEWVGQYTEQQPIDPKRPDRGTRNEFENIAYGIHDEFWGIMDDIYVNSLVSKKKPAYAEGGKHHKEVKRLYREKLLKNTDFTALPRHKQFSYALLRDDMLPGEDTTVSEDVSEALERTVSISGEETTVRELVREYVKARDTRGTPKAGTRYRIIERLVEPIWNDLLLKDIDEWDPQPPPEKQPGQDEEKGDEGESSKGGEKSDGKGSGGEEKDKSEGSGEGKSDSEQGGEGEEGKEGKEGEGDGQGKEEGKENGSGGEGKDNDEPSEGKGTGGASRGENLDKTFNPGSQEGKESGENGDGPAIPSPVRFPDGIPKNIDDIIDDIKRGKEAWKEDTDVKPKQEEPAEARENRIEEARDRAFCKEYEVNYETLKRYNKVEQSIRPYLAKLDSLWRRIIYGQSREQVVEAVGYYRDGETLDMDEAIREFPKIATGQIDQVRVMKRSETVREMVRLPDLIRVRFLADCSSTMNAQKAYQERKEVKVAVDENGNPILERRDVLEQAFVLLSESLRRFQTYLNLTRGRTKSNLSVDTEVWVYGTNAEIAKPFRGKGKDYGEERAESIRAFGKMRDDMGGTRDDKALGAIEASITPADEAKIRNKKMMELVFELTDGGTNGPGIQPAKEAISKLDAKGVIARAFQIGTTNKGEQDTFQDIWNKDTNGVVFSDSRGHIVGAEVKNLLPALTAALEKYLSRVEL